MYIKQIQIQGFKSYRDQTAVDPFSPRHNVVVGRNGSGKSNFFSAIRFVLADQYATLNREERQALLHDSSSSNATTLSAFVELVFDNADRRFPTNGDEVILRRTIGLKKDEYSIDRRSASKADVANLLEAAGFSRANPYYIVPQGRITALTNAKDHERLDLLKEVAGTRVYEQRRTESLKIMDDTEAKRTKIADLIEYIETKIADLDADRAELAEYYKSDKERRSLEYTLYQSDLNAVATALEKLEEERMRDTEDAATDVEAFSASARQVSQLAEQQTTLEHQVEDARLAHEQAEADHRSLVKALTNAQMVLAQITEGAEGRQNEVESLHAQREALQEQIQAKERALAQLRPELEQAQHQLSAHKDELEQVRARLSALRAKQARSSQFTSQPERDAFLQQQIAELDQFIQAQQERIAQTQSERHEAEAKLAADTAAREQVISQVEGRKDQLDTLTTQWREARQARDEANERKKDLWNEEVRLQSEQTFARERLNGAERALSGTMDRATMNGLGAVDRIARQLGLTNQVHGPFYKLFTVDDRFKLPVEVVAGKSLFHVVVDNDDTAARIIEVMNRERSGRVTFMPLNRLSGRGEHTNFPQASDAVLMIRKIQYDDRFRVAMEQVFGKTIICPNLEIAGAYVRSNKVDAITLDGDRVERKGAVSGGFHDPRASRMDAIRSYQRLQDTLADINARLESVRTQATQMEQEATQHLGDMQRADTRRRQLVDSRGPLLEQIAWQRRQEEASQVRVRSLVELEADQQTELRKSQATQLAFQEEMHTPLAERLSDEEEALLTTLTQRVDELSRLTTEGTNHVGELQVQLADLDIDLNEDLRRRRDELDARLEAIAAEGSGAALGGAPLDADAIDQDAAEQAVETLERRVSDRAAAVAEHAATVDRLSEELRSVGERLETLKAQQAELGRTVGRQQKGIERYLAKKHRLQEQRDKTNRNIRDLGVLPEEAFDARYASMRPERLAKQLAKVKDTLKKYAHVNKKAVEQWSNFTKQRDDLLRRRTEIEESGESIQELIQVLDQRKDEAIERTFKLVSKNFEEIFAKLVPAGRGRLIMQKRLNGPDAERDEDEMDTDDDDEGRHHGRIESYTGVSIKVSFNSKSDEGLRVQQLSGGQKSLVALATVFAIQRCDPAPFYLFDEIDANLDAQYRTAVANMIHELADNAQFITTTFRPELVAVADKHYGVFFNDRKVSTIHDITQADAEGFVEASAEPAR